MFVDERQRVSHRRGAIARGVAKRGWWHSWPSRWPLAPRRLSCGPRAPRALPRLWLRLRHRVRARGPRTVLPTRVRPRFRIPRARLQLVPPQQRRQLATRARRRGRTLPRASGLRRIRWPSRICRRDCRPDREPDRNRRCRQEASRGLVLDYRIDADGKAQTWVAPTQLKLDEGATAADAFVKLQQKVGFKAKYDPNTAYGFYLESITSPSDGRTLAFDPATYAYWQLFVDGASSSVGASGVKLTQGQKIEFAYTLVARPLSLRTRLPQM